MATNQRTVCLATVALVVGFVLVALGAWMICSAYQTHQWMATGYEHPYQAWETAPLLLGIALSIIGAAVVAGSETYRVMTKRRKGV